MLRKFQLKSLIIASVLIIGLILLGTFLVLNYSKAQELIKEGDQQVNNKQYRKAVSNYQQAEQLWWLYKQDSKYQNKIIETKKKQVDLVLFLKMGVSESDIQQLMKKIEEDPRVFHAAYTSPEEALQVFKNGNQNDPTLIQLVTANMLPSSIAITLNKNIDINSFAEEYKMAPIIDDTAYGSSY